MRVLALVEACDHVCYRYRIAAFAGALRMAGMSLEALPPGGGLARRLAAIGAARHADVVILQRKLLPLWQLWLLRKRARRLVYDFDDAVFQRDSYSAKPAMSRQRLAAFWATIYAADLVIAGNSYLGERAAAYVGAERVHVVPTCVAPVAYRLARHDESNRRVRLAWIGQRSTMAALERASEHLAAAAAAVPGLELAVIADSVPSIPGVHVVGRTWSSATEAAELATAQIGISWLPDDAWSRGKCGLKVLQYMAAGLPVVVNPVGVQSAMVVPGETGFLARTPAEWATAIARLAADPELRRRMGAAGRRLVESRYSVDVWGPRLAELLALTARGTRGARTKPDAAPVLAGLGALA